MYYRYYICSGNTRILQLLLEFNETIAHVQPCQTAIQLVRAHRMEPWLLAIVSLAQ